MSRRPRPVAPLTIRSNLDRTADSLDDVVGQLQRIGDSLERLVAVVERVENLLTTPSRALRAFTIRHIL